MLLLEPHRRGAHQPFVPPRRRPHHPRRRVLLPLPSKHEGTNCRHTRLRCLLIFLRMTRREEYRILVHWRHLGGLKKCRFPYVDGPLLARLFVQRSDQIACVHMFGLFSRSHMNAGQDGFRDASSKHPSDLWRPVESTECLASWIDRSHHLLVALQVLASAQHGCR